MYLSDQLILSIEKETGVSFRLCDKKKLQKIIRGYFIQVFNEASDATIMASNRKVFVKPNFEDK